MSYGQLSVWTVTPSVLRLGRLCQPTSLFSVPGFYPPRFFPLFSPPPPFVLFSCTCTRYLVGFVCRWSRFGSQLSLVYLVPDFGRGHAWTFPLFQGTLAPFLGTRLWSLPSCLFYPFAGPSFLPCRSGRTLPVSTFFPPPFCPNSFENPGDPFQAVFGG